MVREARIVVPGVPHHVTQRGNNRQDVFFVDDDRRMYFSYLKQSAQAHGLAVTAYALMTNHVHLIAIPEKEESLSNALGRAHMMYAQSVQRTHGGSGHFWQSRFFSCPLDEAHAHNAAAYAELNPVRAGLVSYPWDYPWSSAAAHCHKGYDPSGLLALDEWLEAMPESQWRATLETIASADSVVEKIRKHTRTGRPLGNEAFLDEVENRLGRSVRPAKGGRPTARNASKRTAK
jgi:putative transposase